ncbi:MAG: hypothetical protein K9M98_11570, partial [Cephaloticoccus sp.]|nr:hypothetical protein [Cephaloticoccus sp.]
MSQLRVTVPPWQNTTIGARQRAGLRLLEPGVLLLAMKPHIKLAETLTPDGKSLTLHVHDGDYSLRVNGRDLMHSSVSASELHLGELAAEHVGGPANAKVLIG